MPNPKFIAQFFVSRRLRRSTGRKREKKEASRKPRALKKRIKEVSIKGYTKKRAKEIQNEAGRKQDGLVKE